LRVFGAALGCIIRIASPDVILLARVGGSIEDLWAFNDEGVARAIIASAAPVITGVGHETDFTIADFASDLRAPTPTAAAELATPDRLDLLADLGELERRLLHAARSALSSQRWALDGLLSRLRLISPRWRLSSDRQRLDELSRRANVALGHTLLLRRANLNGLEQRMAALSPMSILGRGYALVAQPDGRIVRSIHQVAAGDALDVRVEDGTFGVRVVGPDQS